MVPLQPLLLTLSPHWHYPPTIGWFLGHTPFLPQWLGAETPTYSSCRHHRLGTPTNHLTPVASTKSIHSSSLLSWNSGLKVCRTCRDITKSYLLSNYWCWDPHSLQLLVPQALGHLESQSVLIFSPPDLANTWHLLLAAHTYKWRGELHRGFNRTDCGDQVECLVEKLLLTGHSLCDCSFFVYFLLWLSLIPSPLHIPSLAFIVPVIPLDIPNRVTKSVRLSPKLCL